MLTLRAPACCSNCEAPCCRASTWTCNEINCFSFHHHLCLIVQIYTCGIDGKYIPALSSSSDSFASLSRTFSTLLRMMPTTFQKNCHKILILFHVLYIRLVVVSWKIGVLTSSTWALVCCRRICAAICWGVFGLPTLGSSPPPSPSTPRFAFGCALCHQTRQSS